MIPLPGFTIVSQLQLGGIFLPGCWPIRMPLLVPLGNIVLTPPLLPHMHVVSEVGDSNGPPVRTGVLITVPLLRVPQTQTVFPGLPIGRLLPGRFCPH